MYAAVVFDFDGLILDTETPVFAAWHRVFVDHGVAPITRDRWTATIGLADDEALDPLSELAELLAATVDVATVTANRRAHRDQLLAAEAIRHGVLDWLDELESTTRPFGIASSSPDAWVDGHLGERGLLDRFVVRSCTGPGIPGKPAPDVYLRACEALGVDPRQTLAVEDSPNGVRAAKAAGMTCLAVPGPMTVGLDFSDADMVVASLGDIRLGDLDQARGLIGDGAT